MKSRVQSAVAVLVSIVMILSFAACGNNVSKDSVWKDAVYTQDKEFGNGKTTVQVEVKAEEKSVTFTLKTDKSTLGEALLENKLVSGENSEYGLYIKVVNGITADYDADKSYWSFCKDGETMMTGVDAAKITDGEHYELVYTK
ncbi:MAG: DUF4430 domain-containing protein [Ruminococcus sp.]|nr:DUF4430 domain-containing protein [Candidatus Copronaster equi]